eukprot:scaffold40731_cov67-Phaeocystis_antarctica.AAC.3
MSSEVAISTRPRTSSCSTQPTPSSPPTACATTRAFSTEWTICVPLPYAPLAALRMHGYVAASNDA